MGGTVAIPSGEVVEMFQYDILTRNQINDLIISADEMLTGKQLGLLRLLPTGIGFEQVSNVDDAPRRLPIVHGTFSNTEKMLSGADPAFLTWARAKYHGQVYAFDHPTLAVSPMVNAFDIWQRFRDVTGDLDIVAHSRGGLVVRWFLEVLGPDKLATVRVVLVGSPLGGTSLAAPRHLRNTLSAVGSFASAVSHVSEAMATVATPWLAVPAMIIQVASSVVGKAADIMGSLPILDAVVSMIPGLSAQARIGGNAELKRLLEGPGRLQPSYFGIKSNFEPTAAGWAFWKRLRLTSIANAAADGIFPDQNDMVVDTGSMSELGAGRLLRDVHDYGTSPDVHHLNYFVQTDTTTKIRTWLN
jgi:hypothetical protein